MYLAGWGLSELTWLSDVTLRTADFVPNIISHLVDGSASLCPLQKAGRQVFPVATRDTSAEPHRLASKSGKKRIVTELSHCRQSSSTAEPVQCDAQRVHRQSLLLRRRDLAELVRLVQALPLVLWRAPLDLLCWCFLVLSADILFPGDACPRSAWIDWRRVAVPKTGCPHRWLQMRRHQNTNRGVGLSTRCLSHLRPGPSRISSGSRPASKVVSQTSELSAASLSGTVSRVGKQQQHVLHWPGARD